MTIRRLVFLGKAPAAQNVDETSGELLCEGEPLAVNTVCELKRRRSPWDDQRPHERVIVGSHPARADVLLRGDSIHPEHVRLYFPKEAADGAPPGTMDLMVIQEDSVAITGDVVDAHVWFTLEGGEEIALGPWRWRYDVQD